MPVELTKSLADLRELDAVLNGGSARLLFDYPSDGPFSVRFSAAPYPTISASSSIPPSHRTASLRRTATIAHMTSRISSLTRAIRNPSLAPHERFKLLVEIGDEASRFKLGGDDKVRVAGIACELVSPSAVYGWKREERLMIGPAADDPPSSTHQRSPSSEHPPRA